MNYSKKIKDRAASPKFLLSKNDNLDKFKTLEIAIYGNELVKIHYQLESSDEVYISKLLYSTSVNSDLLGVLDFYIEIISGKPYEVTNRINLKEIDYYARENQEVSFEAYSPELLSLLNIGHGLYKEIENGLRDRQVKEFIKKEIPVSYSEQIEEFEEFLATHIYENYLFYSIIFDFIDYEENVLTLSCSKRLDSMREDRFIESLRKYFHLNDNVSIKIKMPH